MELSKKQKKELEEFLVDLKKEIIELRERAYPTTSNKMKRKLLMYSKLFLRSFKYTLPYTICVTLIFGFMSYFNVTPFFINNIKRQKELKKTIDSRGNIAIESQYDDYKNNSNIITHYSKWSKLSDGQWLRNIDVYEVDDLNEKSMEIVKNPLAARSVEELFGPATYRRQEIKNMLTKDEMESEGYLEAMIFLKDTGDYLITKESYGANITETFAYLFAIMTAAGLITANRDIEKHINYKHDKTEIREKYSDKVNPELIKTLKIKEENYERLTR